MTKPAKNDDNLMDSALESDPYQFRCLVDDYIDRYDVSEDEIMAFVIKKSDEDRSESLRQSVSDYLATLDRSDFIGHFGETISLLDSLRTSLLTGGDKLADAARLYLLEMDRSNMFIHAGKLEALRDEMRDEVMRYITSSNRTA